MNARSIFALQIVSAVLLAAASTLLFVWGIYSIACLALLLLLIVVSKLWRNYKQNTDDIIFLLNAIENGDYSIRFSEPKGKQKRTLILDTLNRIKEILCAAREEIKANEHFLSIIMERIPLGIIIVGQKGRILNSNRAASKLIGINHLSRLEHLEHAAPKLLQLMNSLRPDNSSSIELHTERQSVMLNVQLSSIEIRGTNYRLYTLNNIGQEFEAFEAESWIRLIRVMTHEIMNSIAPISSISDTLLSTMQEDPSTENRQMLLQGLGTIRDTGQGLLNFVNDYRQFTAVPTPKRVEVEARDIIDQALRLCSEQMRHEGIHIERRITEGLTLFADRQQLLQVLVNLLKNATEAPFVCENRIIRIRVEMIGEGSTTLIEISNNGLPIPAEILSNIFIPFYTTKEGGSGIGLSLSRYILQLHQGKLYTHRSPEGFTCFSIELPMHRRSEEAKSPTEDSK